jgi:hypothetical protein
VGLALVANNSIYQTNLILIILSSSPHNSRQVETKIDHFSLQQLFTGNLVAYGEHLKNKHLWLCSLSAVRLDL